MENIAARKKIWTGWQLWLFPLFLVGIHFSEGFIYIFLNQDLFLINLIILLIVCPISFALAIILSIKRKIFLHWIAIAAGFIIAYNSMSLYQNFRFLAANIKLSTNFHMSEDCKNKAIPIGSGGNIGICETHRSFFPFFGERIESIVYDSTGQILNKHNHRTLSWNKAASSLRSKAPFGLIEFAATKLNENFYYVLFYVGTDTDFTLKDQA